VEKLVKVEDYTNVFNADISFVIIVLTLSLLWKEQQTALITGGILYLVFTILWHY
jgi:hypothetical protein